MNEDARGFSAKPCPICGKPSTEAARPFCSLRCREVDLNRWLSGAYVVPGRQDEDEDGASGADGMPRTRDALEGAPFWTR
jgi:endogenous inhibitor of DNA gyrase (YacG/DUF329 family)